MGHHAPRGGQVLSDTPPVDAEQQASLLEAGRLLFARECVFMLGVAALNGLPEASLPEVAFAGRSNVGKSSLINALTGRNTLARTSNTPGRTQELNFFNLGQRLILVDMPGYGFANAPKGLVEKWTRLVNGFLKGGGLSGGSDQGGQDQALRAGGGQPPYPGRDQGPRRRLSHLDRHLIRNRPRHRRASRRTDNSSETGVLMNTPDSPDIVQDRKAWLERAKTLSEALPFMRQFSDESLVIKFGGHAMESDDLARLFARDVVLLRQVGINPVVVHGGGPQIDAMLKRLDIQTPRVDGLRFTDEATVEVVEMILAGKINKQIVSAINEAGGFAVGLSGKDGHLIRARKLRRTVKDPESHIEKVLDLGFVGEPAEITPHILNFFRESDIIPVIAPVGMGPAGETYNINADTAAGAIAGAINARRLLMLTDVAGVLDKSGNLIPEMTAAQVKAYIADGTISGGMIPKVETCLAAVEQGVDAAVILDGRVPHAILLELFTPHGVGTLIKAG